MTDTPTIKIRNAQEHNLKGVDLDLPRYRLIVVTGLSGSGKSSLAFDTIYKEGARRYLETFSAFSRQHMVKLRAPAVDSIDGLPPVIAVSQLSAGGNSRSTVGTMSGLHDLLRLLYARAGTLECLECMTPHNHPFPVHCTGCNEPLPPISRSLFSFNSRVGACPACLGLGTEDKVDPELLVADADKTLRQGALVPTLKRGYIVYSQVTMEVLDDICKAHGFCVDQPWNTLTSEQKDVIFFGSTRLKVPFGKHPLESRLRWKGLTAKPREEGFYKGLIPTIEETLKRNRNDNVLRFVRTARCRACLGTRLRPQALQVSFSGLNIGQLSRLDLAASRRHLRDASLTHSLKDAARPVLQQLEARLELLEELGLQYLHLQRPSTTLAPGERQRLRLATQVLGGMRNVLYVLDEPSVGLHPAETDRLLKLLFRLRDAGNTILVVEHDPAVIAAADHVVELGPGPGPAGGQIVCNGPPRPLPIDEADHLPSRLPRPLGELAVHCAGVRNLRIDGARIVLGALNAVTGPSGAGKASLVFDALLPALNSSSPPFRTTVEGNAEAITKTVVVDNAPIGRTPRSNAATYTGLWDAVRKLYAGLPAARSAGFKATHFSFNTAGGRCEACHGAGVQTLGLFFLGQVPVLCDVCGGKRFDNETLAVKEWGYSVADLLDLTVGQALPVLSGVPKARAILEALADVGLGYVPLGQPSTTLSGGEAQRIKLATHLASPSRSHTLYALAEPTTGLHRQDIHRLIGVLRRIVMGGHTVVLVEHDLQMLLACDHILDLGPGAGAQGGQLVVQGPPGDVARHATSVTSIALRRTPRLVPSSAPPIPEPPAPIVLEGVSTHNLKDVDVQIPLNQFTVVTGPSGSGKSSLVFDTLYAEGQRRFTQGLAAYARSFLSRLPQADVRAASGLTPPVAVHQHSISTNPRSTLATVTDIHGLLRMLWSRAGTPPGLSAEQFSFNSQAGACPECGGLGQVDTADPRKLVTHPELSLLHGAMKGHKTGRFYGDPGNQFLHVLVAAGDALGHDYQVPWDKLSDAARSLAMYGAGDARFSATWNYDRKGRTGSHTWTSTWPGFVHHVNEEYARKHGDKRGESMRSLLKSVRCDSCFGERLFPAARSVRLGEVRLPELLGWSVSETLRFFGSSPPPGDRLATVWGRVAPQLRQKLESLQRLGLGYLRLDRRSPTLSGGEARRVRLATQLGGRLCGVTYVLDEPTVGLHSVDTNNLVAVLTQLRDEGNTVVVVEHDPTLVANADWTISLGPGGGSKGGQLLHCGPPAPAVHVDPIGPPPRSLTGTIRVTEAVAQNLKNIEASFQQGALNVISGVSGSGKSSLLFQVLEPSLTSASPVGCLGIDWDHEISQVHGVNASPIGRSPASTPATHLGLFDHIRRRFAATAGAVAAGLTPAHFSYNGAKGRCPTCKGMGHVQVAMDFMADVWVPCEQCNGRRYRDEILSVTLNGHSIADVLELSVGEALDLFGQDKKLASMLAPLQALGLDYLPLGQPANTLSGGESQRLKLASHLLRPQKGHHLFLLDEPTRGLADSDVTQLVRLLHSLTSAGNTVVAVEHNLLFVGSAHHVIDLGPGGGDEGGYVVVQGAPSTIMGCTQSATGIALKGANTL